MSDFSDLASGDLLEVAEKDMQDMAIRLKKDFKLESIFDNVILNQGIALTPGSQLVLVIPLIEAMKAQKYRETTNDPPDTTLDVDLETVQATLTLIVEEMKLSPASADMTPVEATGTDAAGRVWPLRSAITAIKAFSSKFCQIPPLCG